MTANLPFAAARQPLVVCCGLGVDSFGMLAGLHKRGIRPDMIIFADVGAERDSTYELIPVLNEWLERVGFPLLHVVRYAPTNYKHWPHYYTIEENCLTNVTLPSIAYGFHTCSAKWKIAPMNKLLLDWNPARECWIMGGKVLKAIGFEDSPHEHKRAQRGCDTFAIQEDEREKYELWFPLQQWGWNRQRCIAEIMLAGLPVPDKSSCYFCTAMKPWEVDTLPTDKLRRIVIIEARTTQRHLDGAEQRGWPRGVGQPLTEGLWRRAVKGTRGGVPKPGSMTEYIRGKGLLPSDEIDRLVANTPSQFFTREQFTQMGLSNWQQWIDRIIAQSADCIPDGTLREWINSFAE